MNRAIFLGKKILGYVPYLPAVFLYTKNPIDFLRGYFDDQPRVILLRNGLKLHTDNRDDISSISTILIKDEYDLGSVKNNAARVIIDIGANKGYFTALAAKNNLHRVFAYEPIPETFAKLKENILENNLNNVTLVNAGVAGTAEERKFSFSLDKSILSSMVFTPGEETITVSCTTLEKIYTENKLEKIDLLKIDCEGAEFETFYHSSDDTLSKISTIKMEYHNDDHNPENNIEKLTQFLVSKGFARTLYKPANTSVGIAWFVRN